MHYYCPSRVPLKHELFKDLDINRKHSDVAYLCLNFAFLPDEIRENFKINY